MASIQYRNRVSDSVAGKFVYWVTSTVDDTGVEYPGPGAFGVDTSDYSFTTFLSEEGGGAVFDLMTDINPAHLWRATDVVESSGLVDTITDIGRLANKNWTQTGGARCPVAVDGDGNTYLAPNGTADYYDASASGFDFLHTGAPWSAGFVIDMNGATATGFLFDDTQNTGSTTGLALALNASATLSGPGVNTYAAGVGLVAQAIFRRAPSSGKYVCVINCAGHEVGLGATPAQALQLYVGGIRVATVAFTGLNNTGAATYTARLFAAANVAASFFSGRLYELWMDNRAHPERKIQAYSESAAAQYTAIG